MKKRKDIDQKYKWNLSAYYKDDDAWQKEFEGYSKKIEKLSSFNGKLIEKQSILSCLNLLEELDLLAEPLYIYAHCLKDLDVTSSKSQERMSKMENKLTEHSIASSFITPQLTKLSDEFLKELLLDKKFKKFEKLIKDILREKPHVLSEESEKMLSRVSLFSGNFDENFSNFENGDLKFNNVLNGKGKSLPLTQSLASMYLRDPDEVLRQNAYIELNSAFGRYNNFLTSNYIGNVKKDVFYAKSRKFDSCLEKSLFYEEVDPKVYNTLIKKVEENLPLEHKLFRLKKKLLGLKPYRTSDVYYNPLKSSRKYTYEQAFETVCDALSILGEDYIDGLKQIRDNCNIDVFPRENKANGAYKTGAYSKPPMVLLNFCGKFDDVSTLSHELGHAMHSVYSNKAQTLFSASYVIFLAEIASTVNETLLNNYMLKNATSKQEKLFYINEFLSTFHATVFRQTMFASFESLVHTMVERNAPISSEILNNKYLELVKKYFGKGVKVLDCVKYEWSRIPHFYSSFYVYKYATGLISAVNIVQNLLDGTITVDDYKKFLSSGCSSDPISLLKLVKVDLTTEEPFDRAFAFLSSYLKELEKLI